MTDRLPPVGFLGGLKPTLWGMLVEATRDDAIGDVAGGCETEDARPSGREANSSVAKVLDCYRVIGDLAANLERQDGWS